MNLEHNKTVLNSSGGSLVLSHDTAEPAAYLVGNDGSNVRFHQGGTSELTVNNKQKLVRGDEFETTNGAKNVYCGEDYDNRIEGDYVVTVGNSRLLGNELMKQWYENYAEYAANKLSFKDNRGEIINYPDNNSLTKVPDRAKLVPSVPAGKPVKTAKDSLNTGYFKSKTAEMRKAAMLNVKEYIDNMSNRTKQMDSFKKATGSTDEKIRATDKVKLQSSYDSNIEKQIALTTQDKLFPIEQQMGESGNGYTIKAKNDIEIIGTAPVPFPSYRKDEKGATWKKTIVKRGGTVEHEMTHPTYENVDLSADIPTGNKTVVAFNSYVVRSYNTSITSTGNTGIFTGGNLQLLSKANTTLWGDTVSASAKSHMQINSPNVEMNADVTVNGNINSAKSLVLGGGMYADGGVSSPQINAPKELDETHDTECYAVMINGGKDGGGKITVRAKFILDKPIVEGQTRLNGRLEIVGTNLAPPAGAPAGALFKVLPHSHTYYRHAGTLSENGMDVSDNATNCN